MIFYVHMRFVRIYILNLLKKFNWSPYQFLLLTENIETLNRNVSVLVEENEKLLVINKFRSSASQLSQQSPCNFVSPSVTILCNHTRLFQKSVGLTKKTDRIPHTTTQEKSMKSY